MRSFDRIGTYPVSLPLSADDVVEFHAARLLLLLHVSGVAGRIDGLTKMAKLDFFARYPDFFEAAKAATSQEHTEHSPAHAVPHMAIESGMVRHHYGPWDKRYYHVLAYLEARQLITVTKQHGSFRMGLTDLGRERARALEARPSFAPLVQRMRDVKAAFGGKTGSSLRGMIYRLFAQEVAQRPLGEVIHR